MSFMDTAQLLGNLGEFIGAIVIVATLIYLAMQIRQNSELIKINGVATNLQLANSMVTTITSSRENAEYWLKRESEFESLDEVDRVRLIFHESVGIINWNYAFELRQRNLLSDESWHRIIWQIGSVGRRQSVREAWQWTKDGFGEPFQDFMNKNLGLPTTSP
jgi:CRISPR/Cas system-associated protein Cas5 (RAMP superfamily)